MPKLNVLFLSSWYPSNENKTLGNFVQKHAEAIHPFVDLSVLYATSSKTINTKFRIENNIINNVNTTIVYYRKVEIKIPVINSIIKYLRLKKAYRIGYDSIIKDKPTSFKLDITHCNVSYPAGIFALELERRKNIPFVLTEHWTAFLPSRNSFTTFNYFIKKSIQRTTQKAKLTLPVSDHLGRSMKNLGLIKSYEVIPNVVDTNLFKPIKNKEKLRILHVSSLENNQKNIVGILNVIKTISLYRSDFVFQIVCDDNYEQTLAIINKLAISNVVTLEQSKETEEIKSDFQNAAFFLLFSNYETFSVVLAEAWSCGIPCLYSKCGGLTEINNSKLGIQVEKKNEKELEEGINYLLDNISSFDSQEIREYALKNFNYNAVGRKYTDVYQRVINTRK